MRRSGIIVIVSVIMFMAVMKCSGPQPHLFAFKYSQPEALKASRVTLAKLGYRTSVFDVAAGVLKTVPRRFVSPKDSTWIDHQIVITITRAHEMRVRVTPKKALDYRDEIMEPIVAAFKNAGIHAKYLPPPRPRPWRRPGPYRRP